VSIAQLLSGVFSAALGLGHSRLISPQSLNLPGARLRARLCGVQLWMAFAPWRSLTRCIPIGFSR